MPLAVTVVRHDPQTHPAPELAEFADVERRALLALFGHDDLANPVSVLHATFPEQTYHRKLALLVRDGEQTVGGMWVRMPQKDNTTVAEVSFLVDPLERAGEAVPALWERVRPELEAAGRTTVQMWTSHATDPSAEQIVPRTGVGSVPADPVARVLQDLGFELEQVERHSVLHVQEALGLAAAELPGAREAAGTAYRTLGWVGPTPPEHLDGMARLMGRMSTDVPTGELEIEAEAWDAERVAEAERITESVGRTRVMTVAQHVASGELVAYTLVDLPRDKPAVGYQEDTLVHGEHRGHRLGMLVKAENLQRLAAHAPAVERLHTWNAGENEHMLAINVALGFRPASVEGGWQQRV
ncbi:GNAT family N-acetyltransferase [Ornithinimicrobium tianjinense]|uniref:GNAT family N-acetyltransferase n=1 Tax=Ornithinimicrobium tianjinense TaxID=1195761 RepID=A0A917F356_9MICO|nr:GNAT family N-acetyltransferase [Ornithinimicrobium tianjinense]GGF46199.1 GNAT family N-acetyltransferase [Ornithinimicrobium tianjinense]